MGEAGVVTKEDMRAILGAPIIKTLEANGITPESLALELRDELRAMETKFFQKDGEITDQRDVIDWTTRQKARQDAHRLMGHYPPEKSGDSYIALIMQQNNLVLSPVVKQIIESHTKALMAFDTKVEDVIDVEAR